MARITVEDCLENVENRFDLVLKASERARELSMGAEATLPWENDKPTVMALREIAAGSIRTKPMEAAEHFDLPNLNTDPVGDTPDASEAANMAAALDAFNLATDAASPASDDSPKADAGESDSTPKADDVPPTEGDA